MKNYFVAIGTLCCDFAKSPEVSPSALCVWRASVLANAKYLLCTQLVRGDHLFTYYKILPCSWTFKDVSQKNMGILCVRLLKRMSSYKASVYETVIHIISVNHAMEEQWTIWVRYTIIHYTIFDFFNSTKLNKDPNKNLMWLHNRFCRMYLMTYFV